MAKSATRGKNKSGEKTMLACLSHPMRTRILELVNEHPLSPVEYVRLGYAGKEWNDEQEALSTVSYHFRVLHKADAIELVKTNQRRGATEHVYSGRARIEFTSEEFEQMSLQERAGLTKPALQGFFARTESAVATGTFDSRTNRHLSWEAMDLDEQGFAEIDALFVKSWAKAQIIRRAADRRLTKNPGQRIPTTLGLFSYESPQLPRLDLA
jgi:DNA-binding transcriptional ArsR family regulator